MIDRLISSVITISLICSAWRSSSQAADEPTPVTISAESRALFEKQIQPLLVKTCGKCHGRVPRDNELELTSFGSAQAILAKPKLLGDVGALKAHSVSPHMQAYRVHVKDYVRSVHLLVLDPAE